MKKVLIIGCEGFIGHNCYEILSNNYIVWGCDIIESKKKYFIKIESDDLNIGDISNRKYDYIINCSGAANVGDSFKNPKQDFLLNSMMVLNILESIKINSPLTKFINLSSAAVYGSPAFLPIIETAKLNPISPYGFHKLYSELLCEEYFKLFGIKTLSLRIFSAYGEGLRKQLFWDIYKKSLDKSEIVFSGTGNETRDFIYIKDLVSAIALTIENGDYQGSHINIANGEQIRINSAIEIMLAALNWRGNIKYNGESREGDPYFWCADIKKLTSLGYTREYDIISGLERYAKWLLEKK